MTFGEGPSVNWGSLADRNNEQFSRMTGNRKRSRDDDTCEFMPLSKRINNLHINNGFGNNPGNQQNGQMNGMVYENQPSTSSQNVNTPSYNPGPSCTNSPYFYDNKLLFELHLERIQRNGQEYPF